jgi:urea transport system substrate-binding protein
MIKALLSLIIGLIVAYGVYYFFIENDDSSKIRVGILHSTTGTMAISENSVKEATLLAIKEINEQGGLLGKQIEVILRDGKSNWPTFANEAEKLIIEDHVAVVFGGWTSASRKTMKPIFERYNHLLFYPVQYEGLEISRNIIYTGAAPNQQIIPAVKWAFDNLGKKFFLVGSDYIFPRTANAIINDIVSALHGEVLGEEYIRLGSADVDAIVKKIIETKPDVILNTINGDSNLAFFRALRAAGITPDKIPTISFSIAEQELQAMGSTDFEGDYAVWNYFQSIDSEKNYEFVAKFKREYGEKRVTDDPIEAGYFGVYLWAKAVRDAGTADSKEVLKNLPKQSFEAPEGMVFIDGENHHTWKIVRVGRIKANGQFEIVWSSEKPIRPIPYPIYRTKAAWDEFELSLYKKWNEQWANPGK